jgi:hypothetical protein
MLTETQIESVQTSSHEDLRDRLGGKLTRRELADREPAESRRGVEEGSVSAGMLRLEMVKCGKERRKKCAADEGTIRTGISTSAATANSPATTSGR